MPSSHRAELQQIRTFPELIRFLRDEMGWPIESEEYDDLVFDYEAEELGLDAASAAKVKEIKRLRPLTANQPWGIFFVSFEPKRLPIVALRRILSAFVMRKRASANAAERMAWETDDLLFISNYGEGEERQLSFAHFSQDEHGGPPTLRVLGWDNLDTALHLDHVADQLTEKLAWPQFESDVEQWRETWGSAFTLRHGEVIATSKALAIRLAELARAIRDRIKTVLAIETDSGPVTQLMKAFKEALVHDLEPDDFADMYAQTVAYGLLSARIANPEAATADGFAGQLPITSPFLRELMETFLHVGGRSGDGAAGPRIDFDELGVSEVVELLDSPQTNMEAVVRDFGDKNPQEDPVIHFYEDFLREYDKKQKVKRGVFYTPRPVASYILRSVADLLRSEFGLADGLADITTWGEMAERHEGLAIPKGVDSTAPFVTILDLATGTGTFLVETIDVVHRTLVEKWKREGNSESEILDLWNDYVPKHLLPRLYGYELLMAPYAIAHLKIGLKLHETGYRFRPDDRVQVYLTNSLEPASDIGQQALSGMLPALAHEAQAVNEVKRSQRFTVVVGNPPYSKSSQNQGRWIESIMEEYKRTVRSEETQIQALSDDYSKFLRFAHFTLERSQIGLLGFITNNSYLDGPLFRDMRSSVLQFFGHISVLNLHGDSRKQFSPPEGMSDENVFDIQQGVAISVFSKGPIPAARSCIAYAELWGTREERYSALQAARVVPAVFAELLPSTPFFLFIPVSSDREAEFVAGWHLYDLFGTGHRQKDNHESYGAGFVTQQDSFAIGFSPADIEDNVQQFLDPGASDLDLWEKFHFCSTNQWSYERAKRELDGVDIAGSTRRCLYRPFDCRYTVFDRNICTIIRKRISSQFDAPNVGLLATRRVTRLPFNNVFVTSQYAEYKVASHDRNTIVFPLWMRSDPDSETPELLGDVRRLNLNPSFLRALSASVGLPQDVKWGLPGDCTPEGIFAFIYAVLHSPAYRARYGEFLKVDFPRVPLPGSLDLLSELAQRGHELVALHLMESTLLESQTVTYVGPVRPAVGRVGWSDDTVWLDSPVAKKVQRDAIGFRGVREAVWNFHIGGYQVCYKWLKDRKGRTLSDGDIAHYQKIVVAIAETIRIMGEIDEVIEEHGGWPGAFVSSSS